MRAFPVVARELRVASRKWGTYWNRCVVGLAAIATAAIVLVIAQQTEPKKAGITLFVSMSILALAHCNLMGFVLTAGALADEKRDGTMGLLFLTDLKGYDVVLGKLTACSLRGVFGLIAMFPILGICLLLGGVSPAELGRVTLVCLNSMFLSLSLGMAASAVCADERKAMAFSFVILLLLVAGLPALGEYIESRSRQRTDLAWVFFFPSPGYSSFAAFDKLYKAERFWPAVVTQHVLGWCALFIACRVIPYSWQDKVVSAGMERRRATIRQWIYGLPLARDAFRRRLLDVNPYYWLTSRDRFKQVLPWIWLGGTGLIWLCGLTFRRSDWRDEGMYILTALALHALFKLWVAYEASRRLGLDRHGGGLELLLCTPMDAPAILRGQWLSLMRQFAVPVFVVLAADIIFFFAGLPSSQASRTEWGYTWACGATVFLADVIALAWVAMWLGFLNRRTGQGGVTALIQIGVLPWLLFLGVMAALFFLDIGGILPMQRVGNGLFLIWWLISIGVAAGFGLNAFHRLHVDLRSLASEQYTGRAAIWGRALGLKYARWRGQFGPGDSRS